MSLEKFISTIISYILGFIAYLLLANLVFAFFDFGILNGFKELIILAVPAYILINTLESKYR